MHNMKTMKRISVLLICLSTYAAVMAQGGDKRLHYDEEKDLNGIAMEPRLLSMHEDYDPMDYGTWPYYEAACTVAPCEGGVEERTALWCTKKATYMFTIYRLHWDNMYFVSNSTEYICDSKTGTKYYVKEHKGAPLDVTYWIKGHAGDYIYSVSIYPPLPKTCTHIDIGQDSHPETVPGTTGWSRPETIKNIPVSELQAHQYLITGKRKP